MYGIHVTAQTMTTSTVTRADLCLQPPPQSPWTCSHRSRQQPRAIRKPRPARLVRHCMTNTPKQHGLPAILFCAPATAAPDRWLDAFDRDMAHIDPVPCSRLGPLCAYNTRTAALWAPLHVKQLRWACGVRRAT